MKTMNDRIGALLDELKITKTAFADKLKVSQQYISKLIRTGTPSDMLIDDICEKFNVSEDWLRTGNGEMFVELPAEDEYLKAATLLTKTNDERAMNAVIEYWKLDDASKEAIWNFINKLAKK